MAKSPDPAASRRGRNNRKKGRAFEKEVAADIVKALDLHEKDVLNSRSGKTECDIHLSEEAYERFPYWIEAKNSKNLQVPAWLKQAQTDAAAAIKVDHRPFAPTPVVVFKQHGSSKKYAIIDFDAFLILAANMVRLP